MSGSVASSAQAAPRLLLLTPAELTRDPRARRAAAAALAQGYEVVGVCIPQAGDVPAPLDGVRVIRAGGETVSASLRRAGLGGRRRSAPAVRELRGLYRLGRLALRTARLVRAARAEGAFDVVHANDLDTLPAGWLLSRRGARLVYDAHELYTTSEPDPPRLATAALAGIEAALARRADAVVTTGETYAHEIEQRLRLGRPPLVVRNCPPRDPTKPPTAPSDAPLRAVYQAAVSHPGKPVGDLLDAAERAPSVELTIRVVNVDRLELEREVATRGLADRVRVAEPVPPDRLVEGLRGFDVGLVIHRPLTPNEELSTPNKLFEYMMAGLAVVAPRLPGMAPVVEREGAGLCFAPGDPASLAEALERLAADRALLAELRQQARRLALERYNAEAQLPALLAAWGRT